LSETPSTGLKLLPRGSQETQTGLDIILCYHWCRFCMTESKQAASWTHPKAKSGGCLMDSMHPCPGHSEKAKALVVRYEMDVEAAKAKRAESASQETLHHGMEGFIN